jgi:hypothetical protein
LEAEVRSGPIVIGVLSLVLASSATIPMPQAANDALVALLLWPYAQRFIDATSRMRAG